MAKKTTLNSKFQFKTHTDRLRNPKSSFNFYLTSCDVKFENTTSPESPIHRHRCVCCKLG